MTRRKTGLVEDILTITATLPWWIGVFFAVIAYAILQHYASLEMPVNNMVPGQIGHRVVAQMWKTMAYYGQVILPILFLVGALISFFKHNKRKSLVRTVDKDSSGNALRDITWHDFELLVGEIFRMRGYSVTETGGGGTDGGIDLILKKDRELFLVQCKQWRAYKVSVNVVRELLGVMVTKGAAGGFVVTSGAFTTQAQSFAKGQNIQLIDGTKLTAMIEKVRKRNQSSGESTITQESSPATTISVTAPNCPRCGQTMIKRIARKGTNAGNIFWGCSDFPKCRGVRAIN